MKQFQSSFQIFLIHHFDEVVFDEVLHFPNMCAISFLTLTFSTLATTFYIGCSTVWN
jgi:hypothetical protein